MIESGAVDGQATRWPGSQERRARRGSIGAPGDGKVSRELAAGRPW